MPIPIVALLSLQLRCWAKRKLALRSRHIQIRGARSTGANEGRAPALPRPTYERCMITIFPSVDIAPRAHIAIRSRPGCRASIRETTPSRPGQEAPNPHRSRLAPRTRERRPFSTRALPEWVPLLGIGTILWICARKLHGVQAWMAGVHVDGVRVSAAETPAGRRRCFPSGAAPPACRFRQASNARRRAVRRNANRGASL
jgi:hypothetical protein